MNLAIAATIYVATLGSLIAWRAYVTRNRDIGKDLAQDIDDRARAGNWSELMALESLDGHAFRAIFDGFGRDEMPSGEIHSIHEQPTANKGARNLV